jgi:hypothetical protein
LEEERNSWLSFTPSKKMSQGGGLLKGEKAYVWFQQQLLKPRIRGAAEEVTRLKTRHQEKRVRKEYDNLKNRDKT